MGANAQTTVPTFTSGQVLTADQQNQSARTGVPVFAGTSERDAAFGGSGEKTLAEGQLCYLESTNVVQYYDGAAWATVGPASAGAMTLISNTTIGSAVSTVTVSNAFSSTYDNYRIVINGGSASTTNLLTFQLSVITTGYYGGFVGTNYSTNATAGVGINNAASVTHAGWSNGTTLYMDFEICNPNNAEEKTFLGKWIFVGGSLAYGVCSGQVNTTTTATGFVIGTSTGTMTGGTIRVYGFANS